MVWFILVIISYGFSSRDTREVDSIIVNLINQFLKRSCVRSRRVMSVGNNHHHLSFDDELPEEPFLLSLIRETIWGLRSLFAFLVQQPSQLKYIEWPSFQSTLKTAILTLVLVAELIVALSSVDAVLCHVLTLLLRRTPS